jgi:hypothetical protein
MPVELVNEKRKKKKGSKPVQKKKGSKRMGVVEKPMSLEKKSSKRKGSKKGSKKGSRKGSKKSSKK